MNIVRDCMFRKINFVTDIFTGGDGLNFVKAMSNERKQCNVYDVSILCDVKSDCSTEHLPKCEP